MLGILYGGKMRIIDSLLNICWITASIFLVIALISHILVLVLMLLGYE